MQLWLVVRILQAQTPVKGKNGNPQNVGPTDDCSTTEATTMNLLEDLFRIPLRITLLSDIII